MNIGIVCYASVGGSGIIATELGKTLASRGHRVHILSSDTPFRLGDYQPGLSFHRVETPSYPLFREPQYLLSLANKIVQVSRDERLDIVHAHYAIPHATAAYLARQILASTRRRRVPRSSRRCTAPTSRCSAATARTRRSSRSASSSPTASRPCPRASRRTRIASSASRCDIRVIPELPRLRDRIAAATCRRFARGLRPHGEKLVIHVSNFRPVKRVTAVDRSLRAQFARAGAGAAADGRRRPRPGRGRRGWRARSASATTCSSSASRIRSCRCCRRPTCSCCRRRRRASAWRRSRRWRARCRSSRRASAGCPRSIEDGVTGFLHAPDDLDGMARSAVASADRRRRCIGGSPTAARDAAARALLRRRRSSRCTRRTTRKSSRAHPAHDQARTSTPISVGVYSPIVHEIAS